MIDEASRAAAAAEFRRGLSKFSTISLVHELDVSLQPVLHDHEVREGIAVARSRRSPRHVQSLSVLGADLMLLGSTPPLGPRSKFQLRDLVMLIGH